MRNSAPDCVAVQSTISAAFASGANIGGLWTLVANHLAEPLGGNVLLLRLRNKIESPLRLKFHYSEFEEHGSS